MQRTVEAHEVRLGIGIGERWTPGSPAWTAAEEAIEREEYEASIDVLVPLVLLRIAELANMNRAGTCE